MNFSNRKKMTKVICLVTVLILMTSLFAGCKKDDQQTPPESTEGSLNLNLNLETTPSTPETTEAPAAPTETEPVIDLKSATVISQLNIRSAPSTNGSSVIGILYAGDKVTVERRETVTGIQWAYISAPQTGWICMDFVEMDHPDAQSNNTSTPAGGESSNNDAPATSTNTNTGTGTAANLRGVVTTGLNIRKEASTNSAIVGAYAKGDVVNILETSNGWGRTNKGWVKLDYVNTTGNTTGTTTNNNTNTNTNVTGNGSTTVVLKGVVKANELNIRDAASTNGNRVGSYGYGARVEVYEKSGSWGRTSKGWISLDYVYQDGTTGTKTGNGTVTGNGLNIRSGPGTGYNAVGSLNSGDRVKILEQFTYNGTTWGCISNGWISLDYVDMDGGNQNQTTQNGTQTGTVTGNNVNIRSGPGTGYNSVGSLNRGDKVTIEAHQTVNDVVWCKIPQGWVCMDFVEVN